MLKFGDGWVRDMGEGSAGMWMFAGISSISECIVLGIR
jgi:hypothetical protein